MRDPDNAPADERPCRWCRGTGSQTDPAHAPQRWRCPDCDGTGREWWCETCGEWHGGGSVCDRDDDHVTIGAERGGDWTMQPYNEYECDQCNWRGYEPCPQHHHDAVSSVQSTSLLASTIADALRDLIEEYEDRKAQFGCDYLWQKHENTDTLPTAKNILKQWDEAN